MSMQTHHNIIFLSKRKPNLIYTYVWEPHIHDRVRDPTCQRGAEMEREQGYVRHPELGMRSGALGASEGPGRMIRADAQ